MLENTLISGLHALDLPVDDSIIRRFRCYFDFLSEKNAVMNLTALSSEADIAMLHFLDCAALLNLLDFRNKRVIDVGSGAGFPGVVLKILEPDLSLTLLDSTRKRIDFLEDLCALLGLSDVQCVHLRAEEAPVSFRETYDIAVSRAVARLNILAELCIPFLRVDGSFLAMKGPNANDELNEASSAFHQLGCSTPQLLSYALPDSSIHHTAVLAHKKDHTPPSFPRRYAQIKKQPL